MKGIFELEGVRETVAQLLHAIIVAQIYQPMLGDSFINSSFAQTLSSKFQRHKTNLRSLKKQRILELIAQQRNHEHGFQQYASGGKMIPAIPLALATPSPNRLNKCQLTPAHGKFRLLADRKYERKMMKSIQTLGTLINEERSHRSLSSQDEPRQDITQSTVLINVGSQTPPEKNRGNKSLEHEKPKPKVFRVKRPTFYNFNPKNGLTAEQQFSYRLRMKTEEIRPTQRIKMIKNKMQLREDVIKGFKFKKINLKELKEQSSRNKLRDARKTILIRLGQQSRIEPWSNRRQLDFEQL